MNKDSADIDSAECCDMLNSDASATIGLRTRDSPQTPYTYDYLNEFTKNQLRDHCRSLGLSKVWTTKDELIEKILSRKHETGNTTQCNAAEPNMTSNQASCGEQDSVWELLAEKKQEIEKLNLLIDEQRSHMAKLCERLAMLEATPINPSNHVHQLPLPPAVEDAPPDLPPPASIQIPATLKEGVSIPSDTAVEEINPPPETQHALQTDASVTSPLSPFSTPSLPGNTTTTAPSSPHPSDPPKNSPTTLPPCDPPPPLPSHHDLVNASIRSMEEKLKSIGNQFSIWQKEIETRLLVLEEKTQETVIPTSVSTPPQPPSASPPSQTLILGDSNLSQLCATDFKQCKIRTLDEATITHMTTWVREKLAWVPDKCIVYGGLFDIKEGRPMENVIDSLGILVSELRKKFNNMKICVSLLCPSIESGLISKCIQDFNVQVLKWSIDNNIHYAETELVFKDKNEVIEEDCYIKNGKHQGSLLNRTGVIRLVEAWCIGLSGFSSYVKWDKVKENTKLKLATDSPSSQPVSLSQFNTASHHTTPSLARKEEEGWQIVARRTRDRQDGTHATLPSTDGRYSHHHASKWRRGTRHDSTQPGHLAGKRGQVTPGGLRVGHHTSPYLPLTNPHPSTHLPSHLWRETDVGYRHQEVQPSRQDVPPTHYYPHGRNNYPPKEKRGTSLKGNTYSPTAHQHHSYHDMDGGDMWYHQNYPPLIPPRRRRHGPHQYHATTRDEKRTYQENAPRHRESRCYNCGESNHQQSQCWFDRMVLCNQCHSYGHKDSLCQYFNA